MQLFRRNRLLLSPALTGGQSNTLGNETNHIIFALSRKPPSLRTFITLNVNELEVVHNNFKKHSKIYHTFSVKRPF